MFGGRYDNNYSSGVSGSKASFRKEKILMPSTVPTTNGWVVIGAFVVLGTLFLPGMLGFAGFFGYVAAGLIGLALGYLVVRVLGWTVVPTAPTSRPRR